MENNLNNQERKEKIIEAVMIFIFDDDKNLLLLKRIDNGQWEPVKGGINLGEVWGDAALRELKEETGLDPVSSPELLGVVNDELDTAKAKKTKIRGHVSYCFVSGISPKVDLNSDEELEHSDYKWINLADVEGAPIYPQIAKDLLLKIVKDFDDKK